MKLTDLLRSLGGVLIIFIGAIAGALVGNLSHHKILFLPVFFVIVAGGFLLYYRAANKRPDGGIK